MIIDTEKIKDLDLDAKVEALNEAKKALHVISPFRNHPVDCVLWVDKERLTGNEYNPNSVAPPEMKLLETSILEDGYTQPIVSFNNGGEKIEIVDGFHRNRVGKESPKVQERTHGYLPITQIREEKAKENNRMASTIRHNRARGTHAIKSMSEIVLSLNTGGWDDKDICDHLGMELEEVVRLKQITGLKQAFANHEFSKSWEEFVSKYDEKEKEDA